MKLTRHIGLWYLWGAVALLLPGMEARAQNCKASFTYKVWHDIRWVEFTNTSTGDSMSFVWSFGDGSGYTTGQTQPGYHFSKKGFYEVCLQLTSVRGTDTCRSDTCILVAVDTVKPPDTPPPPPGPRDTVDRSVNKRYSVCVYPNPADKEINVCLEDFDPKNEIFWSVYNEVGALVLEWNAGVNARGLIRVQDLPSGMYLAKAGTKDRLLGAAVFIKEP